MLIAPSTYVVTCHCSPAWLDVDRASAQVRQAFAVPSAVGFVQAVAYCAAAVESVGSVTWCVRHCCLISVNSIVYTGFSISPKCAKLVINLCNLDQCGMSSRVI